MSETLKTLRNRLLSFLVKACVVGGWFYYSESVYFANFICLLHVCTWCLVPIFCMGFGGLVAATKHIDQLHNQPMTIANAKEMYRVSRSWTWRWWVQIVEAPFLLFIAIAMGDWSFLIASACVLLLSICVIAAGADLYCKLPENLKGGDQNHNGVPDDEEKLQKAGVDPITRMVNRVEEKKRITQEKTESIVSHILEEDL